jgi:hypothetical protein
VPKLTRLEVRRSHGASGEAPFIARPAKVIFLMTAIAATIASSSTVIAQQTEREIDRRLDLTIEHRLRPATECFDRLRRPRECFDDAYGIRPFLGWDPDDQIYWEILRNRELPE